jgi:uncharacterized protein YbcI
LPSSAEREGVEDVAATDVTIPGDALLQITNDVSALMRRFYGKGPARSRGFVNGDLLFLVLEDVLTEFELTFLAKGEAGIVRQIRTRYQELIREEMISLVERSSSHRVLDYMSQILTDAGMLIEIFLLAPPGTELPAPGPDGRTAG